MHSGDQEAIPYANTEKLWQPCYLYCLLSFLEVYPFIGTPLYTLITYALAYWCEPYLAGITIIV